MRERTESSVGKFRSKRSSRRLGCGEKAPASRAWECWKGWVVREASSWAWPRSTGLWGMGRLVGAAFPKRAVSASHGAQASVELRGRVTGGVGYPSKGVLIQGRWPSTNPHHMSKLSGPRASSAGQNGCAHPYLSLPLVTTKILFPVKMVLSVTKNLP